jgi:hypothetical protein
MQEPELQLLPSQGCERLDGRSETLAWNEPRLPVGDGSARLSQLLLWRSGND